MAQQFTTNSGVRGYGACKAITHAAVNVVATAGGATVLAYSVENVYILVVNDSDTAIYLTLEGTAPVANTGIRINANGGYYEMSAAFGNLPTGAIKGIHAGAGNKVALVTSGTGV